MGNSDTHTPFSVFINHFGKKRELKFRRTKDWRGGKRSKKSTNLTGFGVEVFMKLNIRKRKGTSWVHSLKKTACYCRGVYEISKKKVLMFMTFSFEQAFPLFLQFWVYLIIKHSNIYLDLNNYF